MEEEEEEDDDDDAGAGNSISGAKEEEEAGGSDAEGGCTPAAAEVEETEEEEEGRRRRSRCRVGGTQPVLITSGPELARTEVPPRGGGVPEARVTGGRGDARAYWASLNQLFARGERCTWRDSRARACTHAHSVTSVRAAV